MEANFNPSLTRLLAHEGGYCNDRGDPGGPTNFGITIGDYRHYIKPGATATDVRAMKLDDAKAIYRRRYWDAMQCGQLPAGIDDCVMDYGVNSGIGRAGKVLRRLCSLPDNTSTINAEVLAAVARRNPVALVNAMCDERMRFLRSLKTFSIFGRGWTTRVREVRAFDLALATRQTTKPPTAPVPGKGAVPPPTAAKKVIVTGSGAGTVTAGTSFTGWITAHPTGTALILAAIAATVTGLFYLLNQQHAAAQDAPTPGLAAVPEMPPGPVPEPPAPIERSAA